jgi:hypothetical protein
MKKVLLVVLSAISIGLSGCDQLFSELEITFFNMKRIGNIQMDIKMEDIPNQDPYEFTIKTDGYHQVTTNLEEMNYTYFNAEKDLYELILIDGKYNAIKLDKVGNYDFDISIILELFLLAPEDFKLDSDGFYRPTVILYDFIELEFKVVDGYITEMNFKLNVNEDLLTLSILFSNVNNSEFSFPVYHQFTELEQAKYSLELENNIITETELGYDVTIYDIVIHYTSTNEYLEIVYNGDSIYYNVANSTIKEHLDDLYSVPLELYISEGLGSYLSVINFEQLDIYFNSYIQEVQDLEFEYIEDPAPDTTETEDIN